MGGKRAVQRIVPRDGGWKEPTSQSAEQPVSAGGGRVMRPSGVQQPAPACGEVKL